MTFSFQIPALGQPTSIEIDHGTSAIFVGANGAGKTRLAVFIEDAVGERAHRISAHRTLTLDPRELKKLIGLGAESISVLSMPHMSIAQTLYETREVKAQLLDGRGVAVERVHYANQLAFIVLKAIAFDQRSANKDAGDLVHVLQYGNDLEEGASAFAEQFHRGPHRASLEAALDCMQRGFCTSGDTEGHLMKGSVAFGRFHQPDNSNERVLLQRQASSLVERYVQLVQAAIAQG